MIFENNINWYMQKYFEINKYIFPTIANLKCIPSDKQMYP